MVNNGAKIDPKHQNGQISGFYGLNMGISSPIVLKIGLLVILGRNDGQTKLEDNISKNVDRMANNWSKIAQKWPRVAIIGQSLDRHNFAILHPIWTNDPTKMIYSSRRIEW